MKFRILPILLLFFLLLSFKGISSGGFNDYETILNLAPSNPDSAIDLALKYNLSLTNEESDSLLLNGQYLLGLAYYFNGNFILAERAFLRAIEIGDFNGQFLRKREACWNNIGICREILGHLDGALIAYKKSVDLANILEDSVGIMQTQINIGLLNIKLSNREKGVAELQSCLNFFANRKDSLNIALVYQNLAKAAYEESNWNDFIELSKKSQDIYLSFNYFPGLVEIYNNLGNVYYRLGNWRESLLYLNKSLSIATSNGFKNAEGNAYRNLGNTYLALGEVNKAGAAFKQAQTIFEEIGSVELLETLFYDLIMYYYKTKDEKSLELLLNTFQENRLSYLTEQNLLRISELQQLYEYENQIKKIELQESKIELESTKRKVLGVLLFLLICFTVLLFFFNKRDKQRLEQLYIQTKSKLITEIQKANQEEIDSVDRLKVIYHSILEVMKTQKPYLDAEFTITDMARLVNSNDNYVSKSVNKIGGKKWNDLLNGFRVQAFLTYLHQDKGFQQPIMEIANRCGFNSKTTFYRVFKTATGLTPNEYLDQLSKDLNSKSKE
jgi:tetratricopeptide (TPR) repeat protein